MVEHSYEVHIEERATGGSAGVESPVRTERIDFYDAGVWVGRDDGRDFYPYSNVQVIRERRRDAFEDSTAGGEETGESLDEVTDETGEDGDGLSVE